MAKIIKPYKIGIKSWKILPTEPLYNDNGREILRIAVGEIIDGDNSDYMYEDIYKDVLTCLFVDKQGYKVHNSYGLNPSILITCEDDIIPHNPTVSSLVNLTRDKLSLIDKDTLISCFIEMQETRKKSAKKGMKEKTLYKILNASNSNLSYDLIYFVLYEYIFETIQDTDDRPLKNKMLSVTDLKSESYKAFFKQDNRTLDMIKNELLYRFMYGQIKETKGEN